MKEILTLMHDLGMNQAQFAKFLGVDHRTVDRWVNGEHEPRGPEFHVMVGLREALDTSEDRNRVARYIRSASDVGGLSYLLVKLLDNYVRRTP